MKWLAPEVVQTSTMDCGPASLKCLLEGFGQPVSYGRLREACQTGVDGTSIDTLELVANQLGLAAEQILIPADHVFLPSAAPLPALVVVRLPSGLTHFLVAWRRHGNLVQIMDPATGRRWSTVAAFADQLYIHTARVPAGDWLEFARSAEFQSALSKRLSVLGLSPAESHRLLDRAQSQSSWHGLAALDAAVRMVAALLRAKALKRGPATARIVGQFCADPTMIPSEYWSARAAEANSPEIEVRGAILLRVTGRRAVADSVTLGAELNAALREEPERPGRALARLIFQTGAAAPLVLTSALLLAAAGTMLEALLFRGLFDLAGELGLAGQRMAAMSAILLFGMALLLLEIPVFAGFLRLGRQIENRLRAAFLEKIPRLGDRYFQSRLTSDMAERSHSTQRLRHLPDLARQLLRTLFELGATATGIIWLEPGAAPLVLLSLTASILPAFAAQPVLAERDLRVRSHAAALTRYYLDALLGLAAVRAHGAEQNVKRRHESLLAEWGASVLRLQRAAVALEAVQLISAFGLAAFLILHHFASGFDASRVLLLVYWALNLPVLGQDVGMLARQYPYYRNLTLRLLEPIHAPEEPIMEHANAADGPPAAPSLAFRNVTVEACGHTILSHVDFQVEPGEHVAIVGPSGAGKSSLAGVLLGWLRAKTGKVLVDGEPLDCLSLRPHIAWVDPAIQLWNRSLLKNLTYGAEDDATATGHAIGPVIDGAHLRSLLENLPDGLQTRLGEGGALVSGGEGQRVRLGRAMLRPQTRLAILDEPFRGLDRVRRRELLLQSRQRWKACTLLCITHDISETLDFDRVLVVADGAVVENDTPANLSLAPSSRYAELLKADEQARVRVWEGAFWRRIRIHSGRLVEDPPEFPLPDGFTRQAETAKLL